MSIQQIVTINLVLQGDGAATTFVFSPNKLFAAIMADGNGEFPINPSSPAVGVVVNTVPPGWPTVSSATVDTYGNLTLTFTSAPPANVGTVNMQLQFAGNNLSTNLAAWTSTTTINTTLSVATAGVGAVVLTYNPVSSAFTAGTIVFEASDDGGTTWYAVNGERGNQS